MGIDHVGVALLSLAFHQHGPNGIKSQGLRLLPHTAPVLRMCVAWDFTPAVCSFPASSSDADPAVINQEPAGASVPSQGNEDPQNQGGSSALDPTGHDDAAAAAAAADDDSIEQAESSRAAQQSSADGQVPSLTVLRLRRFHFSCHTSLRHAFIPKPPQLHCPSRNKAW